MSMGKQYATNLSTPAVSSTAPAWNRPGLSPEIERMNTGDLNLKQPVRPVNLAYDDTFARINGTNMEYVLVSGFPVPDQLAFLG